MKIVIAGASGTIGQALVPDLRARGHEVYRLVRRAATARDEIAWDPAAGTLDGTAFAGTDAVLNLAGENISAGRWTTRRREAILRSRVDATKTLVRAVGALRTKPQVFLSASAVGFYGSRGDDVLDERSGIGQGFLPEVCLAWETHAEGAARGGVRTVLMRLGVVLTPQGGALARMRPLFKLGLGGRLGSGRQWMSWIAVGDLTAAVSHALTDTRCAGPMNFTTPTPVTNAEFTRALARVLARPAILPVPGWTLRLVFDQMADEALLASTRAVPAKLQATGFTFRFAEVDHALREVVG